MEGLFAVIFIIIGIVNFVVKQQQEQAKHQGGMKKQQPVKPQYYSNQRGREEQGPEMTAMELNDFWKNGLEGVAENEGVEAEDRSRAGSLSYVEESRSSEGICDEHPEHRQRKVKEKKTAPRTEVRDTEEEGISIELTEEHLLSSFIMSEIIGPPRSLRRSIR